MPIMALSPLGRVRAGGYLSPGCVGALPPQVLGEDLLQPLAGDFVDAGFAGTGRVSLSVGQGVQREGPVGIFAGAEDDSPWSVGPGDASLDATGESGSVAAVGLAAQQARLGQSAVAVDFVAQ